MIERMKLKMINRRLRAPKITQNIIIIKMTIEFMNKMEFPNKFYDKINQVRLQKRIIISVELVRVRENKRTEVFNNNKSQSILKQKIEFQEVKRPKEKSKKMQQKFKSQLIYKELNTLYDFKQYAESRLRVSESEKYY